MDANEKIKQLETRVMELEDHTPAKPASNTYAAANNEIELSQLVAMVWEGKWKIIVISFLFAFAAIAYALSLPNQYRSVALLMPNSQNQAAVGLGGLSSQIGGLASLAGINLGGGSGDKTSYALQVLKSREFLFDFFTSNNLKEEIMAVDGWNRSTNTFTYDSDVYDENSKTWVRETKAPFKPEPSLQEVYEEFAKENFSVSQNEDTGMVSISITHYSPYLAKELVDKLVSAINHTVKQQDLQEATKSIKYLELELQKTTESGMQTMFYQLIEQQQQTLMLTKVRDDYVLKIVDKAIVPEEKSKPKRAIIVVLGGILGGILSTMGVLILSFKRRSDD